ncbi:MAG: sugar transferase [Balneolaceae bacterium]|nr:MAG: sugar transferase [Balneolaceae bacterium]
MDLSLNEVQTVKQRLEQEFENPENEKEQREKRFSLNKKTYNDLRVRQYKGKRVMDLSLGIIALFFCLMLYPLIALGIKISSKGSVFYKQKRTGQNGTVFTCYKFRTMRNTDKVIPNGKPDITLENDERIFAFGKFLRLLNLDELPQIINVLKGEMSLVGPRPYPVEECAYWNSMFDDFFYRYAVKPGITGLSQVKGYRGGTYDVELMRKRTDYDLIYVQKNTLSMDIYIVLKTVTKMINLDTNAH